MEKQRTTTRSTRRSAETSAGPLDSNDVTGSLHESGGFGDTTAANTGGTTVTRSAREGASEQGGTGFVERVKGRAAEQLNTQKGRATEGLDTVAQAVRQTTQQLRADQHDTIAQYVDRAAEQIERFSASVRDKDVGEVMQDVQRFARRQPALFIGGSFAVGLLAARFLRSSRQSQEYGASPDQSREYAAPRGERPWDDDRYNPGAY